MKLPPRFVARALASALARALAPILVLGLLPAVGAAQGPAERPAPGVARYAGLVLSSSGTLVAAVESREVDGAATTPHATIVVRTQSGAVVQRIDPCAACRYAGLAFSPDGRALAFVASDPKAGTAALMTAEGAVVTARTTLKGLLASPRWSPDGRRIAVLATAGAHKEAGATQAGAALAGEIGAAVDEQRIAVADLAGGPLSFVSPADTYVYEYAWLPHGEGFVATAAKGDGDDNWWIARLVSFDAAGREHLIAAPGFQINAPTVSPDGARVAVIGGLMSDFGSVGGDVYVAPLSGGPLVDVTPGLKASVSDLAWTRGGLLGLALAGDRQEILSLGGPAGPQVAGALPASAPGARFAVDAAGRRIAFVGATFATPPRIFLGPVAAPAPVTTDNDGLPPRVQAQSLSWVSGGRTVQGWLLGPLARRAGALYPMVTQVHGGPSAAVIPDYVGGGTLLSLVEHGYFVFLPNPRGSYGQGEDFTRANVKDLGGGDLQDILKGVDAAEAAAPVDDHRLGVLGHSYGGFMTMWTVTHSQRFRAAVAGAGIANWLSYYGQNGIDQWMAPFFGASPYEDPTLYDRLSPIRAIKDARTPTFIYVGERDVECPAAQSQEFWHGLREIGTPTSLVVYAGEGHGIRSPEHRKDLADRIVAWFDKYLSAPGA